MFEPDAWTVLLLGAATAAATGLGALPFLFVPAMGRHWRALSSAFAAGLMVAACYGLLLESWSHGERATLLGLAAGVVVVAVGQTLLPKEAKESLHFGALRGANARKALFLIGVMFLHSGAEGIGVGVAFGGGEGLGFFTTAVIALQNIPEGLAISLLVVPRGGTVRRAAWSSIFSSLPQPLLAVPAFLFVTLFRPLLPIGLGLAAGAMLWMTIRELLPDAFRDDSRLQPLAVLLAAAAGGIALYSVTV